MSDHELNSAYDAGSIKVLKGLDAVRKRPGMYIGNTDDLSGLHHMVYEVTDNSVDEALAGHCTDIYITLHKDGSVSVLDNGRGIPVDIHRGEGVSAAQVIMTQLHAGGKFDQKSYQVSGGLHGVGVSVVNALSTWLELVIFKNGKVYFMRFTQGKIENEKDLVELRGLDEYVSYGSRYDALYSVQKQGLISETDIEAAANAGANKSAQFGKRSAIKTGTYIRFVPDPQIFSILKFSFNDLRTRYRELSFLNQGVRFTLIDEESGKIEVFFNDGGLKAFVQHNAGSKTLITSEVFQCHSVLEDIDVSVALTWAEESYDDHTLCFTNTIPQKDGGTHMQGLRSGLTRAVQKFIPEGKTKGIAATGEDIREGLYCVVSVKMPNPKFSSQTKEKLVSSSARQAVENVLYEDLSRWLEEKPHFTRAIVEKVLEAGRAREAAKKARDISRQNKKPDGYISLAGRLSDCSEKDPAKRELYIVEGKSAGGSAKSSRDRNHQAVLGLRGKILNVEKSLINKVLEYEAIRTLITAIGTGLEEECKAEESRYHKIIIMTDADVDGSHIRALLLTFFIKYMYPLVKAGYIYICRPPLFGVKYRKQPTVYVKDAEELSKYIINGIKEKMDIFVDDKQISDIEKERLYELAFKANSELQMLGELSQSFAQADILAGELDSDAAVKLEQVLSTKFRKASVKLIGSNANVWEIEFEKYAIRESFMVDVSKISADVRKALGSWSKTEIKVGGNVKEVDSILHLYELIKGLQTKMFDISRFKGLGEMNAKELKVTGMDVDTRNIEVVDIADLEQSKEIVNILMGSEVMPRRKFIEDNALYANIDA